MVRRDLSRASFVWSQTHAFKVFPVRSSNRCCNPSVVLPTNLFLLAFLARTRRSSAAQRDNALWHCRFAASPNTRFTIHSSPAFSPTRTLPALAPGSHKKLHRLDRPVRYHGQRDRVANSPRIPRSLFEMLLYSAPVNCCHRRRRRLSGLSPCLLREVRKGGHCDHTSTIDVDSELRRTWRYSCARLMNLIYHPWHAIEEPIQSLSLLVLKFVGASQRVHLGPCPRLDCIGSAGICNSLAQDGRTRLRWHRQ